MKDGRLELGQLLLLRSQELFHSLRKLQKSQAVTIILSRLVKQEKFLFGVGTVTVK